MRPVLRGQWPHIREGVKQDFTKYGNAKLELMKRIGAFCSFCERPVKAAEAEVEHMLAKKLYPAYTADWDNFLISCKSCNIAKGDGETFPLSDFIWSDRDRSYEPFMYSGEGTVEVVRTVGDDVARRARKTIELLRLHHGSKTATPKDDRWKARMQVQQLIAITQQNMAEHDSPKVRDQLVKTASLVGFWSVWMRAFAHDPDLRKRLIEAMPGTDALRIE